MLIRRTLGDPEPQKVRVGLTDRIKFAMAGAGMLGFLFVSNVVSIIATPVSAL